MPLAVVDEVLPAYLRRLDLEDSVLVRDSGAVEELSRQVVYVLQDVVARLDPSMAAPEDDGQIFSVEVGLSRARRGIHPFESLRAAAALFEVALPVVATRYAAGDPGRLIEVSQALNQAIMSRVAVASLSYVDLLTTQLQSSRREERRRIARELHDRLGHGLALALQHLDLYRHYADNDADRARMKLDAALTALGDAALVVQHLAAELRRSVGTDGIEPSLRAYLQVNVPPSVHASLEVTGDDKTLPPNVSEELYLILREAIRNALRHADPTELRVTLSIGEAMVEASVSDDGRGFDPAGEASRRRGGLPSMVERTELLGGSLQVTSEAGRGTTVAARVPLAGSGR